MWTSARPGRAHLPAPERSPALTEPVDLGRALDLLRDGELTVEARLVDASNATLYCRVEDADLRAACVYKPTQGERPLWDFPDGTLAHREVSAYLVSVATGWDVVPPTVLRDGPYGPGMVQLWIDVDVTVDLGALMHRDHPALRRMALLDAVINNADRKGGHLLPTESGHVFGVDHGVCFAVEPKLRTVLWGWRGSALQPSEVAVLRRLRDALTGELGIALAALLDPAEVVATLHRVDDLLHHGVFPQPSPDWPAVPWPPF
ncbi:MAG TPA: SCO1664 family protein [Frankiaceae bacterium]|nr:SCO1664 family protein [Frankiaceae bacterium]